MEKKEDSAPPSGSPSSGSPTAHSGGQAGPSSPSTGSRASPSRQERPSPDRYSPTNRAAASRRGPGDGDSPTNPERPARLRSLADIYASTEPKEERSGVDISTGSSKIRVRIVPRRGFHSPAKAKSSGASFHPKGPPLSVSSLGTQEKESSAPSQHHQEIGDKVLADQLKQEMVNVEHQASPGSSSGGPVGSPPVPSGPSPPKSPTGPDPGPQAPGSPSGPSKKPEEDDQALQSHEGQGGSDDPVGLGGPAGSPSGPAEPSPDTTETSAEHPGSGPGASDEPNN